MAETPKRRPGRPRKNPLERQEQFSVRLPFFKKMMLEVMARELNLSLSQTVEEAITQYAELLKIRSGETVTTATRYGFGRYLYYLDSDQRDGVTYGLKAVDVGLTHIGGTVTEADRAVMMPDALKTDQEAFFTDVVDDLAHRYRMYPLKDKELGLRLFTMCLAAQLSNRTPSQVGDEWAAIHQE